MSMPSKRKHDASSFCEIYRKALSKHFRRHSTLLERLPNELFLEIFNYLANVDVVYAFSQLNSRFQSLTLNHCHIFDFKSVSKAKFKFVIEKHNTQQWRVLRLSDDDDTPGQITLFSQLYPFVQYVPQLNALSLVNMKPKTVQFILPQMRTFTHLVSLTIGSVCGKDMSTLELPSLKDLTVNSCKHTKWMQNFRQLESLEHIIEDSCSHEHYLRWPTKLKQLGVFYIRHGDWEIVHISLRYLTQLTHLAVCDHACSSPPPDGQKWEQLIGSSLPLLVNFQFCFKFWKDASSTGDISRIISAFSTPFYLKEKRWFVQCDAYSQQFCSAVLYSLPFAFKHYEMIAQSFDNSVSTLTTDSTPHASATIYKNVKTLAVDVRCEKLHPSLTRNVKHVILKCPGTVDDWLFSINHLHQLSLGSQIDIAPKDFAHLLRELPRLSSLAVSYHKLKRLTNDWKNKTACELLSHKIRSLNLCFNEYAAFRTQDYVKVDELVHIVRIFSRRCQHLTVVVYSRNIVTGFLLRTMKHLRSLKVILAQQNHWNMTKDWLQGQDTTLKDFDYSIIMDNNEYCFWFDNRY